MKVHVSKVRSSLEAAGHRLVKKYPSLHGPQYFLSW